MKTRIKISQNRKQWLIQPFLWLIRLYQYLMTGRPSPCRFVPTCSNYALDAFEQYGILRGIYLIFRRLARCHPLVRSGGDPVPKMHFERDCNRAG